MSWSHAILFRASRSSDRAWLTLSSLNQNWSAKLHASCTVCVSVGLERKKEKKKKKKEKKKGVIFTLFCCCDRPLLSSF